MRRSGRIGDDDGIREGRRRGKMSVAEGERVKEV